MQAVDTVEMCQFKLLNEALWKAMSSDALRSVCGEVAIDNWPTPTPLCISDLDAPLISNDLEHQLRALLVEHRRVSLCY